jgi:glutamate-1-semialdehyde 2,1-aminomutase
VELGEKIQSMVPALELMRFVNSGTEATMSALRVARAATGRKKIVKFEGCYHGHSDALLVKAGSGLATLGNTSSGGVTPGAVEDTITGTYNSFESVEAIFAEFGSDIAAVIVEPIAANMGLILPQDGFLHFLRDITQKHGALLILDEVMTGFRLAPGGAAEFFNISADLYTFAKIVGGGLPAALYGGKREIMEHVAPLGRAYQAGTLSGNPLAMAAGLATLNALQEANAWKTLETLGKSLDQCVQKNLQPFLSHGQLSYSRCGSFFCFFFGLAKPPQNFTEISQGDMKTFARVYHAWLDEGIYLGPSGYEVGFLSLCHEPEDFQKLVGVVEQQLKRPL